MRVVSGKKSAVKKSNEPRGVRVWRTRILWRACVFQFVCVCVCARTNVCHAHASATVWRHKGGVLVNGTLVGAPRRRRGEQHVEKGSRRATSILEASLRVPFGQFGRWSFKNRPVVRLPRPRPPRITYIPQWREIGWTWHRGVRFSTPFQREIRIWERFEWEKCISLRRILKGISWEGGFVNCRFYEREKNKKTLLCFLMSRIRQIVRKRFVVEKEKIR